MPRIGRIVIPGVPHHLVQRGNNRQDVFFVDDDRKAYLALLHDQAERCGIAVLGYCLMSNHVHLIVRPERADGLAKGIGRAHFLYSQYINRRHGRSGHLWQGRFYSCALDEAHFWTAMRYVEQNAVRAGLARRAWEYDWSSAAAHAGAREEDGIVDLVAWRRMMGEAEWREALTQRVGKEETAFLRKNTARGWPLATDRAAAKFEMLLGRRLRPLRVGRPLGAKDRRKRRRSASVN